MSRHSRRGFTLIELLVVITVIGMLMALLFPAINSVIKGAQKTTCQGRLEQIGKACLAYHTVKGSYPPEVWDKYGKQTTPVIWPTVLLGFLDRGDLETLVKNGSANTVWGMYLEAFVCPSTPPDNTTLAWLGYAANAGQKNGQKSAGNPGDSKQNGVFMPRYADAKAEVTMSYISNDGGDGLDQTLLVVETGRNGEWNKSLVEYAPGDPKGFTSAWWDATQPANPVNDKPSGKFVGEIASAHNGGANVVMASSKTVFLSESVDPAILRLLFTTRGALCTPAQTTPLKQSDWDK